MGKVLALPLRGQPGDLDLLGQVAVLTVMAVELTRLAQHGEVDEIEITLNDQQMLLSRQDMLLYAADMRQQRQAILDALASAARRW